MQLWSSAVTGAYDTIFSLLDALCRSVPLSVSVVEAVIARRLSLTGGNEYFHFYSGAGPTLGDGTVIASVELRVARDNPAHRGFLLLGLGGRCVTLDEISGRYGTPTLTDVPRGRSDDEETSYAVMQTSIRLGFGFAVRNPDCLATIVVDPASR